MARGKKTNKTASAQQPAPLGGEFPPVDFDNDIPF